MRSAVRGQLARLTRGTGWVRGHQQPSCLLVPVLPSSGTLFPDSCDFRLFSFPSFWRPAFLARPTFPGLHFSTNRSVFDLLRLCPGWLPARLIGGPVDWRPDPYALPFGSGFVARVPIAEERIRLWRRMRPHRRRALVPDRNSPGPAGSLPWPATACTTNAPEWSGAGR